jgi:hypothetical protein
MRRRITGFAMSTLLFSAVAGLTAPPTFATDYFVKYLNEVSATTCPQTATGPRHGSVVFRRTSSSMFATVYLRNAAHNHQYAVRLMGRKSSVTCTNAANERVLTTDANGNGTVQVGPSSRSGKTFFWVQLFDGTGFTTGEVPAFGF